MNFNRHVDLIRNKMNNRTEQIVHFILYLVGEDGLQFIVAGIVGARIVLEGVRFDLLGIHLLPILLQGLLLAQAFRLACLLNNHVLVVLLEKNHFFLWEQISTSLEISFLSLKLNGKPNLGSCQLINHLETIARDTEEFLCLSNFSYRLLTYLILNEKKKKSFVP